MSAADSSENKVAITAIGLIGFGEVGQALAQGLRPAVSEIAAYDILFDDPNQGPALKERARDLGVTPAAAGAELAAEGTLVISAVTAGVAVDVARQAADWLRPGQYFLDVNSISPDGKRQGAKAVTDIGGRYVEAAIMSPIHPKRHQSPILLGGPHAATLAETLTGWGMDVTVKSAEIGRASANKLCRSIMVKGLEALVAECLVTSRRYGVEAEVLTSLDQTFPGIDWHRLGTYMLERVLVHGQRRAEEMRFAAETVAATGLEPLMAAATAERQQWVVDEVPSEEAAELKDADLEAILDRLGRDLRDFS